MLQLRSHGTLVVAQYTSEGIAVASDSLQRIGDVDETALSRSQVRKLFRMDKRTVCAFGDMSGCTGPDEEWIDFSEAVEKGAVLVSELRKSLSFQDKCDLVASELDQILQKFRNSIAGYTEQTVSTLLFFGYQGRDAKFGVRQFAHEKETITSIPYHQPITDSELWVLGPSGTVKARMAVEPKKVANASVFPSPICSLTEAASFVGSLVSESIGAEPEILGGPVQVATIPRNYEMEPPPLEPKSSCSD